MKLTFELVNLPTLSICEFSYPWEILCQNWVSWLQVGKAIWRKAEPTWDSMKFFLCPKSWRAVEVQNVNCPSYEFSSSVSQEMQLGNKLIVTSLLPITNDCFTPLYHSWYYNGLALTELPSLWILFYKTKIQIDEGILTPPKYVKTVLFEGLLFYMRL